jgi:SdiA-regulated
VHNRNELKFLIQLPLFVANDVCVIVAVCDIPTSGQVAPLFRDSSNCRILKLSPQQLSNRNITNPEPNEGFEGVACDPDNGRLFVIQEKSPMLVWSVNFTTGVYETLIDVQKLPSWTSRVTDLSAIAYCPIGQTLYVMSQESKVILQSKLDGTLIGDVLSISMTDQPEGLSFIPTTGELVVFGEPDEVARFTKKPAVSFRIYNAATKSYVANITNGATIPNPPCLINIEAVVPCATTPVTIQLRRFSTGGTRTVNFRVERTLPFFLFGDTPQAILSGSIAPGTFTLRTIVGNIVSAPVAVTFGACVD